MGFLTPLGCFVSGAAEGVRVRAVLNSKSAPCSQGHTQHQSAFGLSVDPCLHTGIVVPSEQLQDLGPGWPSDFPAGR